MAIASLAASAKLSLETTVALLIRARLTNQEAVPPVLTQNEPRMVEVTRLAAAEVQAIVGPVADADATLDAEVSFLINVDFTARLSLLRLQAGWSGKHNADVTAEIRALKAELAEWGATLREEVSSLVVDEVVAATRSPLEALIEKLYPGVSASPTAED